MNKCKVCCFWRNFGPASNEPPKAIKELFKKYKSKEGVMGAKELVHFVNNEQRDNTITQEMAQEMIKKINTTRKKKYPKALQKKDQPIKDYLSVNGFYLFLYSDYNAALPPTGVYQDMNAPLSHYFIFTGHNSYLTGNQLTSDCSDIPIINALERGVRVIELDLWRCKKNKDDVEVRHGGTLTSPVELIRCLESIKEHAFTESNNYPVIITFEDHLTSYPKLQGKVAEMLTDTFGEMLYTTKSVEKFPSPAELKGKILISTKPPKVQELNEHDEEASDSDYKHDSANKKLSEDVQEGEEEEEHDEDDANSNCITEYIHRIAIIAKKFKKDDYVGALRIDPQKVTRLSLSESELKSAVGSHATKIIRFTQRNLLRIYPSGLRINSSNYNPLLGWAHGAQMVALNMQGYGHELWMMQGMFRANGGCGYVKKPDILLNDDPQPVFFLNSLPVKKILKVKVYAGDGWRFHFNEHYFDCCSPPDFYTVVGIVGVQNDTVKKKTKVIEDDWTPIWDQEFEFPLTVPELALLQIEVYEHDITNRDDFAGQTYLPVWELRTGIRSISLCDEKGDTLPSVKLLLYLDFENVYSCGIN
ncbi:phosphoinositide phospholipase C 2-like [Canna indica]|uniref:Phosphoinositide phospholipase C n=1 Tax=Canna indica TaxID=4628 RepID=A0AAQ3QGK0_9LILI|nr:phosphoinositide phospholipase C 2-like [Canna indica]